MFNLCLYCSRGCAVTESMPQCGEFVASGDPVYQRTADGALFAHAGYVPVYIQGVGTRTFYQLRDGAGTLYPVSQKQLSREFVRL
jgi:hypothetical protein